MKKRIIIISLILCMVSLFGCAEEDKPSVEFHPYQKIMQLEATIEAPDPSWIEKIKNQLIDTYGYSEENSEKIIQKSNFERYQLEYASIQDYDNNQYPYRFMADLVIWKSESHYAVCSINNKATEPYVDSIEIKAEGPQEPWVENLILPKVLPISQGTEITMGSRISFIKDGQNIGPFTVVRTFYIPYPSI